MKSRYKAANGWCLLAHPLTTWSEIAELIWSVKENVEETEVGL